MDIQGLIRLAYQADLEGNYKVADNLTERAIREAKARWKLNAEAKGIDFGNVSNEVLRRRELGNVAGPTGLLPDADMAARELKKNRASDSFGSFLSREKDIQPATLPAAAPTVSSPQTQYVRDLRRRLNSGEKLTPIEMNLIAKADARNKSKANSRANAKSNATATGGDATATGGAGGAGGAGGNAGAAAQANNANNVGVGVNNTTNSVNQNQNILGGASSYSGGNTMTVNNKIPSSWPSVLAGGVAAGGAGYLGYLIGKDGRPVAPAPNAKPGDFKANQLSERAQAHQMGNAQGAQNFIEARKGNPQFQTAQDFYYAAQAAGMSQSDMNQIAALAKAEGFRDKTPLRN